MRKKHSLSYQDAKAAAPKAVRQTCPHGDDTDVCTHCDRLRRDFSSNRRGW